MSEIYKATFDAIIQKIEPTEMSRAVEEYLINEVTPYIEELRNQWCSPSVIYRPTLSIDGNKWCALYGENLQDGVCGFGDTPAQAMDEFDQAWNLSLKSKTLPER